MIKWKSTAKACLAGGALCAALIYLAPNLQSVSSGAKYGPFVPTVVDGDTIKSDSQTFRLVGVDSCEMGQPIRFDEYEDQLNCGYFAREFVKEFIGDDMVVCYDQGSRSYQRIVARCFVHTSWPTITEDIGAFAIHSGWAVPTDHAGAMFKMRYMVEYLLAKVSKRGAWNGSSVHPAVWREENQ